MAEDAILNWLKMDDYRKVARACESSPKPASEIAKIVNLSTSRCAEVLQYLEQARCVEHTGTGWKITDIGKKVLDKYFQ